MNDSHRKKPQNTKAKKPGLDHALVEHCLYKIYMDLEVIKANNGGSLPYGTISKIVDDKKDMLIWLNKDRVNNYLKKKKKEQQEDMLELLNDSTDTKSANNPSMFDLQLSTLTDLLTSIIAFNNGYSVSDKLAFTSARSSSTDECTCGVIASSKSKMNATSASMLGG